MTVLDTNVFSEVVKPEPSPFVMGWLAGQKPSAVFLTTVTQAELLYGLEAMQQGKRRKGLQSAIERILAEQFGRQMLPFDEAAARLYAKIVALRESKGLPISQFDAMIAAICRSHDAALATRNGRDFEHCGVRIIDPWNFRA